MTRWCRRFRPLPLVVCAVIAACSAWQPSTVASLTAPLGPRGEVQLWVGRRAYRVHGVFVRGDTVHAVSWLQPPRCDTCMLHFPLTSIDSVQRRGYSWEGTQHLGQGVMIVTLLTLGALIAGVGIALGR
jgi:hypothetical protein